jgi:hypothetical protein
VNAPVTSPPAAARIAQLIRLLGSAQDGELTNARDALVRALKGEGMDFHSIADLVASHLATKIEHAAIIDYPTDWRDMARWLVLNNDGLAVADFSFVFDLHNCKREADAKECSRLRVLYAQAMRSRAR